MLGNTILEEQHQIFKDLQRILHTDKTMRAAALKERNEAEAAAKQNLVAFETQLDQKINNISEMNEAISRNINSSEWSNKVEAGTSRLVLSSTDAQGIVSQCYRSAAQANTDVANYLEKYPSPSKTSAGCLGFIVGVVTFIGVAVVIDAVSISAGAVSNNTGTGGAAFGLFIGAFVWLVLGLALTDSRKTPLRDARTTAQAALESAQQEQKKQLASAKARYQHALEQISTEYMQKIADLDREFPLQLEKIRPLFAKFRDATGTFGYSWQHSFWSQWMPTQTSVLATRFGEFRPMHVLLPSVPAMIGCPGNENLLFEVASSGKQEAIQAIQSLMLRLLATQSPGKVRFTLIDPIGLGQSVAPFMQLSDFDEKIVGNRAWSEGKHIEQQLADLSEHMGYVIQKYLRGQYENIEDYNIQAGEVAEPYRILVVTGFPAKFSSEAAIRLTEIATNGPRCGVFTVVLLDTEQPLPYDFNLDDLKRVSARILWDGQSFIWHDPDFMGIQLLLDTPPLLPLFNKIIQEVGKLSVAASEVRVPFERVALPPSEWWKASTRDGIRVPVGRVGATKLQYLDLGKGTAQHVLVAGKTGAGKTNLLHVLLVNLALIYSPAELELYLVDFKTVGFTPYAAMQFPHARVIAIQSEREFGLSVLQGLDKELEQRKTVFSNAHVQDIAQFRSVQPTVRMPRVLLLVDEFQEFFTYDDKIAQEATLFLDRLVRQGRAFGMHVMLGSQTLSGAYTLARTTIGQMAIRIALQCEEMDSRLILSDDNPAARLLSRPGEAIYNANNGLIDGNNPFQSALLPEDELERYLGRIHTYMQRSTISLPWQQIIFRGDADADVAKNILLSQILAAPYTAIPMRTTAAWVGDPIAIKEAVAIQFKRQAGNNLLIVGAQEEAALGIQATALLSLAASYAPQHLCCYIFDFTPVDYPLAGQLEALKQSLPHKVEMVTRRTLPTVISEIYNKLTQRMDTNSAGAQAIYLCIYGLQRIRDLRPDEEMGFSSFGDSSQPPSLSKQFATILREGPELGIHTIVWCDTYTNVTRSLERNSLREFEMRVVFQMSADDSTNLIDVPDASKVGMHRAFLYNDETGRLEKFLPYGLPSSDWLQQAITQIQQKASIFSQQ